MCVIMKMYYYVCLFEELAKMKKNVLLFFTMIITLFVFCGKAYAVVMYMECNYDDCINDGFCDKNAPNTFALITFNDGNIQNQIIEKSLAVGIATDCWFSNHSFLNQNCPGNSQNMVENGSVPDVYKLLQSGVCPTGIRNTKSLVTYSYVLAGKGTPSVSSSIEKNEYIVYKRSSDIRKEDTVYVIIGYNTEGEFAYLNADMAFAGTTANYQAFSIGGREAVGVEANKENYWKVASNFHTLPEYVSGQCKTEEACYSDFGYEKIFTSNDLTPLKEIINEWYNAEGTKVEELISIVSGFETNDKFSQVCNEIDESVNNATDYMFPNGYADEFLEKLTQAYNGLVEGYDIEFTDYSNNSSGNNNYITPVASAQTYFWNKTFNVTDPNQLVNDKFHTHNIDLIRAMMNSEVSSYVEKKVGENSNLNLVDIEKSLDEYTRIFLLASTYMSKNYQKLGLSQDMGRQFQALTDDYEILANSRNIYVVLDCEGLLGEELINKINSYFNVIKIAIPIILIGLGIVDFTGAMFASDDAKMKKAQQTFIKRVVVSIIIFITPTLLNMILRLANEVWPIITPNTCGIGG